jgi:hypothetical protein
MVLGIVFPFACFLRLRAAAITLPRIGTIAREKIQNVAEWGKWLQTQELRKENIK